MNFYHDETGRQFGAVRFARLAPLHFGGGGGGGQVQETEYERAYAEVARKKLDLYNQEYKPFVDQFIASADELATVGAADFVQGAAATATGAEFDRAAQTAETNLQQSGMNPNSGGYKARMSGLRDVQGAATGENVARASNELIDQYAGTLQNISAVGRGESASAQTGLSDVAQLSASKARADAMEKLADSQAMKSTVAMGLGAAAGMYGGAAKPATAPNQAQYNNARMINYNQSLA